MTTTDHARRAHDVAAGPRRLPPIAAAILCGLSLAGWCGDWHWLPDLFAHFRLPLVVAAAVGLVAAMVRGTIVTRRLLAVACLANAWPLLPYWLPPRATDSRRAAARERDPLSVVSVNVHGPNREVDRVVAYLRDRRADLVALVEVRPECAAALESLRDEYPHRVAHPRPDNFGLAVLSRRPLVEPRIEAFGGVTCPVMVVRVGADADGFLLVVVHPHPPIGPRDAAALRTQLAAVADFVAAAPLPCLVAGDFNATPWSAAFRDFVARSGLRDSALGHGVQPTWNARLGLPVLPIDHVLVPAGFRVLGRRVGPDVGSDHLPVEVELATSPGS